MARVTVDELQVRLDEMCASMPTCGYCKMPHFKTGEIAVCEKCQTAAKMGRAILLGDLDAPSRTEAMAFIGENAAWATLATRRGNEMVRGAVYVLCCTALAIDPTGAER